MLCGTGFGCVCTIATCLWSFFIQAAVMAMVYPLFILVACKSEPLRTYQRGPYCLPYALGMFCVLHPANVLSNALVCV